MSLDLSRPLAPLERRLAPLFSFVLLAVAAALASLVFACATPFAAFAVVAAALLSLPAALAVVGVAWIVNQVIGYGVLGYPHDASTIAWGLAIGVAALVAVVAAKATLRLAPRTGAATALVLSLVAAYAAYELVLLAFTPWLGDAGDFSAAIVGQLGVLNVLWLASLLAVCAAAAPLLAMRRRQALS